MRLFRLAAGATLCASAAHAQLPQAEYAQHRAAFAARIDSGVVVAFGERNPVADFGPFFQLPAFLYLTNYREADAAYVMIVRGGQATSWLFVTPQDPRRAFYSGRRPDSTTVARTLGLTARPVAQLAATLDSLVGTGLPFWTLSDVASADFARADSITRGQLAMRALAAARPGLQVKDAHPVLNLVRAKKSPAELALLKKAAEISSEGHRAVMAAPEAKWEYEIKATMENAFTRLGAARPAYGSIIGAGANGTQLHYMLDRGPVKRGDLVVMDAAAEYEGYAADVTRTIPNAGKFTADQRKLYQLVRDAQAAAERNSKPGMNATAAQDSSEVVRTRGLAALGLVESDTATFDPPWRVDCARAPRQCKQSMLWMIHGISHGIGLEVHDPAQFYDTDRTFKLGDAFTIEPGIYISTKSLEALPDTPKNRAFIAKVKGAVARYENSGIRIEDSYIITEKGLERVSFAPREIPEIEALMAKRAPVVVP
ncbi:MAG: aminopeptidase P N-terminal domain-containing protein [Gemmatimonadetes bacterium]|nr:aminopeptidase P N-terminal domain-containing protein [Gemmatimonadota bacterium]